MDCRSKTQPPISPRQAIAICDRNFGVGADGVIFVLPPDNSEAQCTMRIYNSDGSEPEMCGNGIRCMARYFAALEGEQVAEQTTSTLAGLIRPNLLPQGGVRVDMGEPILVGSQVPTTLPADTDGRVIRAPIEVNGEELHVTCISMGNPHAILFVEDLEALDFEVLGPALESHPAFPARANIEFVQVLSRTHLKMKVWERGAGPTLACGTGACALLVAAVLEGRADRACTVTLPGGDLLIEWHENNRLDMTGPAEFVFSGEIAV